MRPILFAGLVVLLAACASSTDKEDTPVVMVVDAQGAPIKGALVIPEADDSSSTHPGRLSTDQLVKMTSDAQGIIHSDLDDYYWQSDGCFHFAATKKGYLDTTVSVSKELFPTPLRIRMDGSGEQAKPGTATPVPKKKAN